MPHYFFYYSLIYALVKCYVHTSGEIVYIFLFYNVFIFIVIFSRLIDI